MLTFHATTEEEKYEICERKYGSEYSIYNKISYEEQMKAHRGFADPENNFYSFYDGTNIIGYINLIKKKQRFYLELELPLLFAIRDTVRRYVKQ